MENGIPSWAKVVATIGIPGAIAAFLLAQNAGLIRSPMQEIHADLAHHVEEAARIQRANTRVLRAICRHQAATILEKQECDAMESQP